jgi:predicted nucleic acid-binding protein
MLNAARLWAQVRKAGKPTADPKELDGDVILAAQALAVGGLVVTDNPGYLGRFVTVKSWT